MKRLFLLWGLLFALITPTLAQTKTDTIIFDINPIADDVLEDLGVDASSEKFLIFAFPDSIKTDIEVEWDATNGTKSQRLKPGESGFKPEKNNYDLPKEYGIYSYLISDSGQIRIYYTYNQHFSSYGIALRRLGYDYFNNIYANNIPVISVDPYYFRTNSLDVNSCTALTLLACNYQLTTLDVSHNTALTELYCQENQLTTLDVSHNTALTELWCYRNQLTTLDVSHNTALTGLYCPKNQLTTLDVSHNTALTELYCQENQLTTLDVSHNTALTELYCNNNQLTDLDVSHNTELEYLYCQYNQLTSLDVSHNTTLTGLGCQYNQLTSLDVSHNTELWYLYCQYNQLTSLDVSHNTELLYLDCQYNQLTDLDVSFNKYLTYLYCENNQLTDLDVSFNKYLTYLRCNDNQLTSLDVSHNTELEYLYCQYNQLTSLDVSNNTHWVILNCANNHIPLNMLYNAYTQKNDWWAFVAEPQTDTIFIQSRQLLDLSSERLLGENVSTFEISDASGQTLSSDAWTEKDFTFRFHKNGLYKLTLQNPSIINHYFDYNNSLIEGSITFTWYISVVDEIPEGSFTVLVATENAEWGTVTGNGTYQEGKDITITAFPNKGYRFINWTKKDGSVFSTDSVHTFKVTENLELTAHFEKLPEIPDDVANESFETNNLHIYAQDRTIYLSENRGLVQVFNTLGQCVYSGTSTAIPVPQSGLYIVRMGTRSHKVLVR